MTRYFKMYGSKEKEVGNMREVLDQERGISFVFFFHFFLN